jgi:citrate synthase
MMTESSQLIRGLEGVVAAETRLCDLDGKNGRLAYGGYDIDELARQATFEEVCYLLWQGELPTRVQLDRFQVELAAVRGIPEALVRAYALMPRETDPMRVLQASVAVLGMHDPDATDNSREANLRKAVRLTSSPPRSAPITACAAARPRCLPIPASRSRPTSSTC